MFQFAFISSLVHKIACLLGQPIDYSSKTFNSHFLLDNLLASTLYCVDEIIMTS